MLSAHTKVEQWESNKWTKDYKATSLMNFIYKFMLATKNNHKNVNVDCFSPMDPPKVTNFIASHCKSNPSDDVRDALEELFDSLK